LSKDSANGDSKLEKQRKKAEKLREKLAKMEKKLQDANKPGMKRKRDSADNGDDDENGPTAQIQGDLVDQVIAKVEAEAIGEDSDSTSSGSEYTSDSDSDSGPEAQTSRQTAPVRVPPPKKAILQRHCKYYSTGGTCGKKGKCRFIHDEAVRAAAMKEKELNGGRPTLAQRLVQNEKEKNDLMVLKSIKHLHDMGLLDEPPVASASHYGSMGNGTIYQTVEEQNHMDSYQSYGGSGSGFMDEV
jgi:hypothetical protein